MSLETEIIQHQDYVEAIVVGDYDREEAVDKFLLVLAACHSTGLLKVLIDYRKLQGEISAFQKIAYANEVIDKMENYFESGGKGSKLAYVGKVPQVSTYEPGLEVAESEGIQAITVEDIDEALKWLDVKNT